MPELWLATVKAREQVIEAGNHASRQKAEQQRPNAAFNQCLDRLSLGIGEQADVNVGGARERYERSEPA